MKAAEVAAINSLYSKDPQGLIVAALLKLGDDAFVDPLRFKGPERIPPDSLRPGS